MNNLKITTCPALLTLISAETPAFIEPFSFLLTWSRSCWNLKLLGILSANCDKLLNAECGLGLKLRNSRRLQS